MFVDRRALSGEVSLSAMPSCGSPASRRLRSSIGSRRMSSPFHLELVERAEVEHRKPAAIADDGLPVDDAGTDGQSFDRGGGEWETVGEVVAVPAEQADAVPAPVREDAKPRA